jgi:hypothetical protein
MDDDKLLKMSLITSCIGIFALFIILMMTSGKVYQIEELKELDDYEKVVAYGKVVSYNEDDKLISMGLAQQKLIMQKTILFKENNKSLGIKKDDLVKVSGEMYEGKLVASKIEKVS